MLADLGMASQPTSQGFDDKINLRALIDEGLAKQKSLVDGKKLNAVNSVPADLPQLQVDRRKIERMIELLIRDEATNLPQGGKFEFAAAKTAGVGDLEQVQLTITDNGPGLPSDAMRSIFDPFYVRVDDPQEFGLNLMACFFIVYHHGGTIEVQNNPAGGATFTITLPTNPHAKPPETEKDFLAKVLSNETLWERLLAGTH
jgi:K+-sensing histidine kinase KdpD